jgi:F-type H+-transporting ATPase subunit b
VALDWVTVAAQIANFLVLVWLLRRFLYRPITQAMERREARMRDRLAEAAAARAEVAERAAALDRDRADLDAAKEDILNAARQEADRLRARLEADIRAEMSTRRAAWHDHLEGERAAFARSLRRQANHHLIAVVRRVLGDFAQTELGDRVAAAFADRLRDLDERTRATLSVTAARSRDPVLVETGFPLEGAAQGRIARALHELVSAEVQVDFAVREEVLFGVRVTIGEQTLDWSAARYLDRLEATLTEVLEQEARMAPSGDPAQAATA